MNNDHRVNYRDDLRYNLIFDPQQQTIGYLVISHDHLMCHYSYLGIADSL